MFYCTAHSKRRVCHLRRLCLRRIKKTAGKNHYKSKSPTYISHTHLKCDYFKMETAAKIQLATIFLDPVVLSWPHLHINICSRIGATSSRDLRMTLDDAWMCSYPYSPHPSNLTKLWGLVLFPWVLSIAAHYLPTFLPPIVPSKITIFLSIQPTGALKPQFPNLLLRCGVPTDVQRKSRISRNKDIQAWVTQMRINATSWQSCCAIRNHWKKL